MAVSRWHCSQHYYFNNKRIVNLVALIFLFCCCHIVHANGLRFSFLGDLCDKNNDCIVVHSWCNSTSKTCQCNEGYFPSLGSYLCEKGVKLGSMCVFHKQCKYLEPNSLCARTRGELVARCRCKRSFHEEMIDGKRKCEPGSVQNGFQNHINSDGQMSGNLKNLLDNNEGKVINHDVEEVGAVSLLPIILGIIGSMTVISTFFILAAYIFRRNRRQFTTWPHHEHASSNISSAPPPTPFSTLRSTAQYPPPYSACFLPAAYTKNTCPSYPSSSSGSSQPSAQQVPKNDPPPSYEEAVSATAVAPSAPNHAQKDDSSQQSSSSSSQC